jgi:hypothetical protein
LLSFSKDRGIRKLERTCLVDLIARGTGEVPLLTEPVALDLHLEATLDDRVASQLTKRALRKLQYVRRDAIFFQKRFLNQKQTNNAFSEDLSLSDQI